MHTSRLIVNGVVIDTRATSAWTLFFWKTGLRFLDRRVHRLTISDLDELNRVETMWRRCIEGHEADYNCAPLDEEDGAPEILRTIQKIQQAVGKCTITLFTPV
jgi:hypothetical protein